MMKIFLLSLLFLSNVFAQEFTSSQMQSIQENLIKNGGFESGKSSHTLSNGTFTVEGSVVFKGNKSLKVVASAQTPSVIQDSTRYAAQLADGVQGIAYARVKSNMALKLCARKAGVTSTVDCVDISNENKWGLYKVPIILGGTSNGISIASSGSVTGTAYIDDAFVGAVDIKADAAAIKVQASTATGSLGAGTQFTGSYTTTDSGVYTVSSGVATFVKRASVSASFSLTSSTTTSVIPSIEKNGSSVTGDNTPAVSGNKSSSSFDGIFEVGDTLGFQNDGAGAASASSISFTATSTENTSIYSALCGANCVDTFTAFISSAGAVSGENIDWINGNCISNATNNVCTINSSIFSVAPSCVLGKSGGSGEEYVNVASDDSFTVFFTNSAGSGGTKSDTYISCSKTGADFVATRTIVGSFNEVVTAPGITKPKTCYYAFGGAGSLSSITACTSSPCTEYYDNCDAAAAPTRIVAGKYSLTFGAGTFANNTFVHCSCVNRNSSNVCTAGGLMISNSSGGLTDMDVRTMISSGGSDGTLVDGTPSVKCEGLAP